MRNTCLLLLMAALWSTSGRAQEVGLRLSGSASYERLAGRYYRKTEGLSYGGALYYEQPIAGRLALSAGLGLARIPFLVPDLFTSPEESVTESVTRLEVPVYAHLRLLPASGKAWSIRLLGGYTYARELEGVFTTESMFGEKTVSKYHGKDLQSFHYLGFGLEGKYQFRNRQTLSLSVIQRWQALDTRDALDPAMSRRQADCLLVLSTGYNFRRPRRVVE